MSSSKRIVNKGTGAGGSQTNVSGLGWEQKTTNEPNLIAQGFQMTRMGKGKSLFYLSKLYEDSHKTVYYTSKAGFKKLVKSKFNVDLFREPDEAYIVHLTEENTYTIWIIEKKNQNNPGSVEEKILAGYTIRAIYQTAFQEHPNVTIHYAFCISAYLKKNYTSNNVKYVQIAKILGDQEIPLLYGDDEDYFEKLNALIGI